MGRKATNTLRAHIVEHLLAAERKRAVGQPRARTGVRDRMLHQSTQLRFAVSIFSAAILLGCGSDSNEGASAGATGGSGSGMGGTNATGGLSSAGGGTDTTGGLSSTGGSTSTGGTAGIISTQITACAGAVVGSACSTAGPCDNGSALPCLCDGSTIVTCLDLDAGFPEFDGGGFPGFDGGGFPNF